MSHTTLGVLLRWLYARRVVAEQMQATRNVVIVAQLRAMRATYPA
jgi:hypothetical protein